MRSLGPGSLLMHITTKNRYLSEQSQSQHLVNSLARTLVDSVCELDYRSGRISEVGFLTAFTERSEILKASGIHPTIM